MRSNGTHLTKQMDFSALYPSIIQAFNLAPTSQIGKFFILQPEIKNKLIQLGFSGLFVESTSGGKSVEIEDEKTDLGPALSDFIQSMDISKIGEVFMNLPNTEELYNTLNERLS